MLSHEAARPASRERGKGREVRRDLHIPVYRLRARLRPVTSLRWRSVDADRYRGGHAHVLGNAVSKAAALKGRTQLAIVPQQRCAWPGHDPFYIDHHDREWGVPVYDSRALWEHLVLDGFQAGLSWLTILRKRDNFRVAFAGFDPEQVANFGEPDVDRLLSDPGIIRSKVKINAAINNARAYLTLRDAGHDFSMWVWGFVDGGPGPERMGDPGRRAGGDTARNRDFAGAEGQGI
jgi:DNA-3-methyladenine glycosylase I